MRDRKETIFLYYNFFFILLYSTQEFTVQFNQLFFFWNYKLVVEVVERENTY